MNNKQLFVKYLTKLKKYAYSLTRSKYEAEELLQNSYFKATSQLELARGVQYFYNAIDFTHNSSVTYKHATKRDSRLTVALNDYEDSYTPILGYNLKEMLSHLTERQADVVVNVVFYYNSIAEYARKHNLNENTVKSTYRQSIKKLKEIYD